MQLTFNWNPYSTHKPTKSQTQIEVKLTKARAYLKVSRVKLGSSLDIPSPNASQNSKKFPW